MANKTKKPYKLPANLVIDPESIVNGVTIDIVKKYIRKHNTRHQRYKYLKNLYEGFHDIFNQPDKEEWKPDNRLAINFSRFITDTFLGYGYGIPIKVSHENSDVSNSIEEFEKNNEINDHDFELFKKTCIFGHAFEYFFQDENTQTRVTIFSPQDLFVVYDDTVSERALFAVRYGYRDTDGDTSTKDEFGGLFGEILTKENIIKFADGKIVETNINPYGLIPVVEYRLNDERIGLYEGVAGAIETYDHIIGEKANDVDAFAEAYLAIIGAEVDEEGVRRIHDDRVINTFGTNNAKEILVQFLQKPTADTTQENLLDRLEKLIYQTSMVSNISDQSYGNDTSGIALAYKNQAMSNLAMSFDRKIMKSMSKRYKIFCSLSTNVSDKEAYKDIQFTTTRNLPKNQLEEVNIANNLEGLVSKETQLKVLSIVDDVKSEIDKIKQEETKNAASIVDIRMFD